MKEYLSHLLPRLIEFNYSLDRKELFIEQPWVYIDENRNKHQYIFRRDGKLIISLNGEVRVGSWEYISATDGLLLDLGTDKDLWKHRFIDKGVLLLRKDNLFDDSLLLVNQKVVADQNVEKYIRNLLITGRGRNILPLDEGINLEYESDDLTIGSNVYLNAEPASTGIYRSEDGLTMVAVEEGRITELKYQKKYPTQEGQITVTQSYEFKLAVGDKVMKLSRPAPDGIYNPMLPEQPIIHVKDGRIFKVSWGGRLIDWIWVIISIALIVLIAILGNNLFPSGLTEW